MIPRNKWETNMSVAILVNKALGPLWDSAHFYINVSQRNEKYTSAFLEEGKI